MLCHDAFAERSERENAGPSPAAGSGPVDRAYQKRFFKGKVKPIFKEYPDVVSVNQLRSMLHIGRSTAYSLVQSGAIQTIRIGKKYLIPKSSVIAFAKKTK